MRTDLFCTDVNLSYVPVFGITCTFRGWSICTFICVRTFTIGVARKGSLQWSQAHIVSVLERQIVSRIILIRFCVGYLFYLGTPPPVPLKWSENGCALCVLGRLDLGIKKIISYRTLSLPVYFMERRI